MPIHNVIILKHLENLSPTLEEQSDKTNKLYGRFEVFTAVTMKNAVFWDFT
jgi:hypothetical protein